ncbi:transposase family protein [Streptomyces sp. Wb2n-11]|uniref:transposase family protein n=1 Tax=Streptomyces sp. Wb2n-11 TaxID=1030533 RepID=UPI000A8DC9DB|nr:transposase family protein [Streptomyces sp. Wb2n-11]
MVTYRATPNVPSDLAPWLENLIAARRDEAEGSWRILTPWDQTVPALVRMTKGDTFEQLGKHFGTSIDTAWRYVDEAVEALAALTPTLEQVLAASGERRRPLLDGTLIPAWRRTTVATGQNPDPLYSGKHRDHGVNVQALTAPEGELVLLGGARPGSTHDLTAARADGIVEAVTAADVETTADSGYQGAGGTVRTPIKHPRGRDTTAGNGRPTPRSPSCGRQPSTPSPNSSGGASSTVSASARTKPRESRTRSSLSTANDLHSSHSGSEVLTVWPKTQKAGPGSRSCPTVPLINTVVHPPASVHHAERLQGRA